MKYLTTLLAFVVMLGILVTIPRNASAAVENNTQSEIFAELSQAQSPAIVFTRVRNRFVKGKVFNVSRKNYVVAVYIYVDGGWWVKPTFKKPATQITFRNNFKTRLVTGGYDRLATKIQAYVVPRGFSIPLVAGDPTLPESILVNAIAMTSIAPTINFTYVPPYGSYEDLRGKVSNARPSEFKVVVFIEVYGVWWIKPYWDSPSTAINSDGTFTTDITTGGSDELAKTIRAFLVPIGYPISGSTTQSSLIPIATDWIEVTR